MFGPYTQLTWAIRGHEVCSLGSSAGVSSLPGSCFGKDTWMSEPFNSAEYTFPSRRIQGQVMLCPRCEQAQKETALQPGLDMFNRLT